jgi:Flp pilus assembly protein TadG
MIRKQPRRGTTLVEGAIILPVTFFFVAGLMIGAMGVFRYHEVAQLAREAARFAAVHAGQYASENAAAIQAGTLPAVDENYLTTQVIQANAAGMDTTQLSVQVNINTASGSYGWDDVAHNKDRAVESITMNNGVPVTTSNTVTVTVTYSWLPELYVVGPITLSSTAVAPLFY